jgi:hypothetical protein
MNAMVAPVNRKWRWAGAIAALGAMALYYALFFLPPRLVGANDPDRYYHLGLARLESAQGLLLRLPQVEDLGWGRYFPDKEFLFHAFSAAADWLAGSTGVLLLVPLFGLAIVACLYAGLIRVLHPRPAVVLLLAAILLSPVLLFRLTLLRPHLLAILCFCLLVVAILRRRGLLAAVAAGGFALSYHALYSPLLAIAVAAVLPWPRPDSGLRSWQAALAGLVVGTVLNPYFPSTLVMSWLHVKLALGIGLPPGLVSGTEVQAIGAGEWIGYFGFLPLVLVGAAVLAWRRRLRPSEQHAEFWFLFLLSLALVVLTIKNSRASEYSIPTTILLCGYCLALLPSGRWLAAAIAALLATQGAASWTYYRDCWQRPQGGNAPAYLAAAAVLPAAADGKKVFNCQWEAGAFLVFARPKVRFVDLLEPAFLWQADPRKYVAKQRLIFGLERDPHRVLRETFHADYVLCGTPALNRQMEADRARFRPIPAVEAMMSLRVYEVRN